MNCSESLELNNGHIIKEDCQLGLEQNNNEQKLFKLFNFVNLVFKSPSCSITLEFPLELYLLYRVFLELNGSRLMYSFSLSFSLKSSKVQTLIKACYLTKSVLGLNLAQCKMISHPWLLRFQFSSSYLGSGTFE